MTTRYPFEVAQQARSLTVTPDGLVGTIQMLVPWQWIEPIYDPFLKGMPDIDDMWPGITQPQLRCVQIDYEEGATLGFDNSLCMMKASYSTDKNLGEEGEYWARWSYSSGVEQLNLGDGGWIWLNANTKVDGGVEVSLPTITATAEINLNGDDFDPSQIALVTGMINDRVVYGFPVGQLKCESVQATPKYKKSIITSWSVTYTFSGRRVPWDMCWRPATQARDKDGNLLFWQIEDSAEPWYSTAANLVGQPVWVKDLPGQSTSISGLGAWDTPKLATGGGGLYEAVDFGSLTKIPIWESDDPIGTP